MTHIELYVKLWNVRKAFPDPDGMAAAFAVMNLYSELTKLKMDLFEAKEVFHPSYAPKISQIIPELYRQNAPTKFIQQEFKMTRQAVNYNKMHPSQKEYTNPVFTRLQHYHEMTHTS